tara:strand:- start:10078 stop:10572 length:495 start_codon:yes stop_codon:yes gene_type:complete
MSVKVLSQRERRNLREQPIYSNWKTKICECFDDDCGMFLFGCICANTSIPQMYERIVSKGCCLLFTLFLWSTFSLALTVPIYVIYQPNVFGVIWGLLSLILLITFGVFLVFRVRNKLRTKSNISGNTLDDLCTSIWCCCCSHMQHMREDGLTIENYSLNSINAV